MILADISPASLPPFFIMSLECVTVKKLTNIPFSRLRAYNNLFDNVLTWFRCPLQSSFRPAFLFNEWSFKVAVRTNPKFLSSSIHNLHFLVTAGFLALITSKDAFDRTHENIVFMEGFNVCV
jgi:hypothetical protein